MLERMQMVGGTHAFQRGYGGIFRHAAHFDHAGAYNFAVKDHRAGTALTLAATNFDTGELQLIAQHVHKHIVGVSQQAPGNAVNHKGFCFHARLLLMMDKGICLRGKSAPGVRFPPPISRTDRSDSGILHTGSKSPRAPMPPHQLPLPQCRPAGAAQRDQKCWPCGT